MYFRHAVLQTRGKIDPAPVTAILQSHISLTSVLCHIFMEPITPSQPPPFLLSCSTHQISAPSLLRMVFLHG